MDVNEDLKFFGKKKFGGGGRGGRVGGSGWMCGCEQSMEVFVKIQKKNWGGGWRGEGSGWGGGGGVRVDVNEELKFL